MFALTPIALIAALYTPFTTAATSELLNLKTDSHSGPYGGLHASQINSTHYKISAVGRIEFGTNIQVTDVQNINIASVIAPKLGNSSDPVVLDVYQVRAGGVPSAQVYFRRGMTYDEIRSTQQISIADERLNYYTWDYVYVFYFCDTPIITDDEIESTSTLFMRRSEVPLPEGCSDTVLSLTYQGVRGA